MKIHVLYVDGDFDDSPPDAQRCQSAAACALWLLTEGGPFWVGPPLRPSQVTVIGWTAASSAEATSIRPLSLADVRRSGPVEAARQALQAIPASASVLLHFDIDVLREPEMPAAYFPHAQGLSLSEGTELLAALVKDPRIRIIEVAEFAALRDLDRRCVSGLVDLFTVALR